MPRTKIPEGDLVRFLVKTRYYSSQKSEHQKNLTLIRNMANRLFRDHVGYTLTGKHRLKDKGEPVFAAAVAREKGRVTRPTRVKDIPSSLRYLGNGSFLWEGSRTLVLGIPSAIRSLERIDFILADHFLPTLREPLLEVLDQRKATLVGLPEITAEATLRSFPARDLHVGGTIREPDLTLHGVTCLSSEGLAPLGFVIEMDGFTVYHPGRSAITREMKTVGDLFSIDVMTLPLGSTLPLPIWAAARAVEWVEPHWVVPWTRSEDMSFKDLQRHLGDLARVKILKTNERWKMD